MAKPMDMFAGDEADARTEVLPGVAQHLLAPRAAIPDVAVHPAANLFPMMDERSLEELADSIEASGQNEPIIMLKGKILDGRNRYLACKMKDKDPWTIEWSGEGSPVQYVIDQNLRRRHLTDSQRATVALDMVPLFEAEAKERKIAAGVHGAEGRRARTLGAESTPRVSAQKEAGKSVVQAAKAVGASPGAVKKLKQAARTEPAVVDLVKQGKATVGQAGQIAQLPTDKRKEALGRIEGGEKAKAVLPPKPKPAAAPVQEGRPQKVPACLRIPCPFCEVPAWQGCVTPGLRTPRDYPHRDRTRAESEREDTYCLRLKCPACKASPGEPCKAPSGRRAAVHNERQNAAERLLIEVPADPAAAPTATVAVTAWRTGDRVRVPGGHSGSGGRLATLLYPNPPGRPDVGWIVHLDGGPQGAPRADVRGVVTGALQRVDDLPRRTALERLLTADSAQVAGREAVRLALAEMGALPTEDDALPPGWQVGDRITAQGRSGTLLYALSNDQWKVHLDDEDGGVTGIAACSKTLAQSSFRRLSDLPRLEALRRLVGARGLLPAGRAAVAEALGARPTGLNNVKSPAAWHRVGEALGLLEKSQGLIELAAQALSPVCGMDEDRQRLLTLKDRTQSEWTRLRTARDKKAGRIRLDSEPER